MDGKINEFKNNLDTAFTEYKNKIDINMQEMKNNSRKIFTKFDSDSINKYVSRRVF